MAFLVDIADGDVIGPKLVLQDRSLAAVGTTILLVTQYRDREELRVVWPIDNTGGENATVPGTWTYGGNSYTRETAGPKRGYGQLGALYEAVYTRHSAWRSEP